MQKQNSIATIKAAHRAFQIGDIAETERICAEILARSPANVSAWQLLTETALQRGRHDAAKVSARRALALAPQDPISHTLHAKCLFFDGETAMALAATEAATRLTGSAADELDAAGAMFGLLGLHDRAKELFSRAVVAKSDEPQYLFNLAATERMTGSLREAESHCDAANALQRRYALAHYLRSDLRIQTAARNHVDEMEGLLHNRELSGPDEVLLRFALGKECEDLDRYDRAYEHVSAGCRLQHALMRVDPAQPLAEIDHIMAAHNRDWIESAPAGYASAAPVFVAGLPRTGTTLIERIIASHPAMRSVGETSAFANVMQRAMANQSKADPAAIGEQYIEGASAFRVPKGDRFLDKTLDNYLYCGLIHAALPNAKIILVQRQPLDACWAMLKAHFRGKFLFTYDQVEVADYYLAFRRLARHWKATLPPDVLMEIDYEEVVRDQRGTSRRLIDFLGLRWDDEVFRFHSSKAPSATASAVQVRRPIYTSSVGKWRHYADQLGPLRQRLAREIAEAELQ